MEAIMQMKRFLSFTFKMKDLGHIDTILGIKIKINNGGYLLSQSYYIEKVLNKFNHLKIKEVSTLFDPSIKLVKNVTQVCK